MKDEDDKGLFRKSVGDAVPLRHEKAEQQRRRPAPRARFTAAARDEVLHESLHGPLRPEELETGDELLFRRPQLPERTFRKLRSGGFRIQAEMDLHGLTSAKARTALDDFLAECARERAGCVRIIHGKGKGSGHLGPVLKPSLARWLARREVVLAYCSALPKDGGTGAVYVLLHRP